MMTKKTQSGRFLRLGLGLSLLLLLLVRRRNQENPAVVVLVDAWCGCSGNDIFRRSAWILHPSSSTIDTISSSTTSRRQRRRHSQGSTTRTNKSQSILNAARQDDEDDDDDDEEPPEVGDVQTFLQKQRQAQPQASVFGLNRGRSSPSHRQALGKSGVARIYLCTHCGSESIQWLGRCPTCLEWNTLQEHAVVRRTSNPRAANPGAGAARPLFGSSSSSSSWLDNLPYHSDEEQRLLLQGDGAPVRVTDLIQQNKNNNSTKNRRIIIPDDPEFNRVLGGGIVPGSLILVGGDPGTYSLLSGCWFNIRLGIELRL